MRQHLPIRRERVGGRCKPVSVICLSSLQLHPSGVRWSEGERWHGNVGSQPARSVRQPDEDEQAVELEAAAPVQPAEFPRLAGGVCVCGGVAPRVLEVERGEQMNQQQPRAREPEEPECAPGGMPKGCRRAAHVGDERERCSRADKEFTGGDEPEGWLKAGSQSTRLRGGRARPARARRASPARGCRTAGLPPARTAPSPRPAR